MFAFTLWHSVFGFTTAFLAVSKLSQQPIIFCNAISMMQTLINELNNSCYFFQPKSQPKKTNQKKSYQSVTNLAKYKQRNTRISKQHFSTCWSARFHVSTYCHSEIILLHFWLPHSMFLISLWKLPLTFEGSTLTRPSTLSQSF